MNVDQLKKLGPFRIVRVIGRGGMGAVYEAVHEQTQETVALKVLTAPEEKEELHVRFEAEIGTLKRLRHPNIVRLYGFGEENGLQFYAMELVDGPSLQNLLKKNRFFTWEEVVHIGIEISKALKHAHDRGVIHRDIKPANILLLPDGQVKVSDYGIAHFFGDSRLTTANMVIGTIEYMAPEQAQAGPLTPKSDLYSLGALLYNLITGNPPYRARTLPEIHKCYQLGPPESIRYTRPEVPSTLDQFIMELLRIQPEKRPKNAQIVARRLEAIRLAFSSHPDQNPFINIDPESGKVVSQSVASPDPSDRIKPDPNKKNSVYRTLDDNDFNSNADNRSGSNGGSDSPALPGTKILTESAYSPTGSSEFDFSLSGTAASKISEINLMPEDRAENIQESELNYFAHVPETDEDLLLPVPDTDQPGNKPVQTDISSDRDNDTETIISAQPHSNADRDNDTETIISAQPHSNADQDNDTETIISAQPHSNADQDNNTETIISVSPNRPNDPSFFSDRQPASPQGSPINITDPQNDKFFDDYLSKTNGSLPAHPSFGIEQIENAFENPSQEEDTGITETVGTQLAPDAGASKETRFGLKSDTDLNKMSEMDNRPGAQTVPSENQTCDTSVKDWRKTEFGFHDDSLSPNRSSNTTYELIDDHKSVLVSPGKESNVIENHTGQTLDFNLADDLIDLAPRKKNQAAASFSGSSKGSERSIPSSPQFTKIEQDPNGQTFAGKKPKESRYVRVQEEELDDSYRNRHDFPIISPIVWGGGLILILISIFICYSLRRPTADVLYEKIERKVNGTDNKEFGSSLRAAEDDISSFLKYYPNDFRSGKITDYLNEIKLSNLERRLEKQIEYGARNKNLTAIEIAYLEAIRTAGTDPEKGILKLRAFIQLFSYDGALEANDTDLLEDHKNDPSAADKEMNRKTGEKYGSADKVSSSEEKETKSDKITTDKKGSLPNKNPTVIRAKKQEKTAEHENAQTQRKNIQSRITSGQCVLLARRRLESLEESFEKISEKQLSLLNNRLDYADAIEKTDPQHAEEIRHSITVLYIDYKWAAPLIERIKKNINDLKNVPEPNSKKTPSSDPDPIKDKTSSAPKPPIPVKIDNDSKKIK